MSLGRLPYGADDPHDESELAMTHPPVGHPITTPAPTHPPRYDRPPRKVAGPRRWRIKGWLDSAFFVLGTVLMLWLAWILLSRELTSSWVDVGYLVAFWLLVAYVGLPRLQEVLARVYVPDYFIGRTVTGEGMLGDPVNLALDGTAHDVHRVMQDAGWVRADPLTVRTSWGIVVSAVLRRAYPAAPVSPLLLFGRQQAFAYEQEVDGNAAQRHHVRFWPVPQGWSLPGGYRVDWLAAATYDRAVGLSTFTLQVTHKVDSDIDIERDYVVATVRYARPEVPVRVINDFATAFHTRNGGGDLVRTDGNLPVLFLTGCAGREPEAAGPETSDRRTPLASLRIPPPAVLLAGLLSLAKVAAVVAGLVALWSRSGGTEELTESGWTAGLASIAVLTLWLGVLWRHPWARTMLMAVCAAEAVLQFGRLTAGPDVSLGVLLSAGVSVVILVAASSNDARRWVEHPLGTDNR